MRNALLLTGIGTLILLAGCGDTSGRSASDPGALGLLPTAPSLSTAVAAPACGVGYAALAVDGGNTAHTAADANANGWICETSEPFRPALVDDSNTTCSDGQVRAYDPGNPVDGDNGAPNGYVCMDLSGEVVGDDYNNQSCSGCGGGGGLPELPAITCPAGYEAIRAPISIGGPGGGLGGPGSLEPHPDDLNENGYLCENDEGDIVDDIVEGAPPVLSLTAGKVSGHGVYEPEDATLSFSFHARSDGATVNGNFEFHDRGAGTAYHGDVTCLEVDGSTALLEGVITNGKDSGLAVGTVVTWVATDNGEGKKAPADEVSAPETRSPEDGFAGCGLAPTEAPVAIDGGNVQVH